MQEPLTTHNTLPYSTNLLIQGESVRKLKRCQAVLEVIHNRTHIGLKVNTITFVNTGHLGHRLGTPKESHRFAPVVTIRDDLGGPAERIQGRLRRKDSLRACDDDDGIESNGLGSRVGGTDIVCEDLSHNCDNQVQGLEGCLKGLGLLNRLVRIGRGKDADRQSRNSRQLGPKDGDTSCGVVVVVGRVSGRGFNSQSLAYPQGNVVANLIQLREDVLLDILRQQMASLEADRVNEKLLLRLGEGVVKQTGLAPVIGKGGRPGTQEIARDSSIRGSEESLALCLIGLSGETLIEGVWGI